MVFSSPFKFENNCSVQSYYCNSSHNISFRMSDDEDDYVLFGSKFSNPSTQGRIKHVQDEIVTDDKGRRRFHGAFTGGFSAGYFNSVGSKEGIVPT